MSISREPTAAPSSGVSFEVQRFAWAGGGRLEVEGRWYGIRGRRFLRPTLDVEVDGASRRMLALLEHKPWAADDGEEWVAAFPWSGDPVELAAAELAVGPELAVELPPPSGAPAKKTRRRARTSERRLEARPPRAQALEAELEAARAEIEDLRERLAAEQRARERRAEQLEALREETAAAQAAAEELERAKAERDAALGAREAAQAALAAAVTQRDAAVAERDTAVAERDAAAGEHERAMRERVALGHELAAAVKARDKARAERNEWLTRARAATAPRGKGRPAPAVSPGPPASKPDKSQIPPGGILLPPTGPGSHTRRSVLPGWAPRVLAPIALVILIVLVALLIAWAF